MKKLLLSLHLLVVVGMGFSQDNGLVKPPSLGLNFSFYDFKTASSIRTTSLSSTIANKGLGKINGMEPGFGFSYLQGMNSHFDFVASLNGTFLNYTNANGKLLGTGAFLLEANALIHAKMFTDDYFIVPYLTAGIGLSKYKGYYGAMLPIGLGLQVNIFKDTFIMIESQYRIKVSENTNYHLFASVGIVGNLKSL
jgi:OOP family OmpA-OmpF porin